MTRIVYNDVEPVSCAWLNELMWDERIPFGDVDPRSIADIRAEDLAGVTQFHTFAGIGGWSYALRLAGWPDDVPVWTGSCPCQPFSVASPNAKGEKDERHLWPEFRRLIAECKPPVVFGEQVASKAGRLWLAGVRADLEALGYRVGAADLCAAGVGAPHIRQRLYWGAVLPGAVDWLQHAEGDGREQRGTGAGQRGVGGGRGQDDGHVEPADGLRDAERVGRAGELWRRPGGEPQDGRAGAGPWWPAEVRRWADGTTRRIEPGTSPLAHGVLGRVGLLRGYGNAIVPQLAAQFIQAFVDAVIDESDERELEGL